MTSLLQAALTVRKGARASLAYATASGLALLVLLGVFRERERLGFEHAIVIIGAALCVLGAHAFTQLRVDRLRNEPCFFVLDQALLSLVLAHALIQLCGGVLSVAYPALYLLAAFVGSFAERQVARRFVLAAVLFEALLYFVTEAQRDPWTFVLHVVFLALFGSMNAIFTQTELTRARLRTQQERVAEKRRVQDEARLFRLAKPPLPVAPAPAPSALSSAESDDSLFRGSVDEMRHALQWNLELLKRTLQLHTVALFLRDETTARLKIALAVSDSAHLREGPFSLGEGAVGACYQRSLNMNLEHLRSGYSGLCYYARAQPVRSFVAVPVKEHGVTLGVLCADRLEDRPFSAADEQSLTHAVEHLLRALENERVFVSLERSKREHTVLYHASAALGAARSEQAVLDAALSAATQIVGHDFAAITHYDSQTGEHSIKHAIGEGAADLMHLSFRNNASLTAMAVHNRHYLPYRGDFDSQSQVVYTRKRNLSGMQSLLILPLVVREEAIGTLALAARRRDAFGAEVRPALQLLSNQLAVALSNAASVARLESLATTDGLTGCFNKRHFHDELKQRLQAAQRFGRKLSLLITDLDHFKAVNDTYGHHTGDVVIRELGQILIRLKRETDVVARFGGEEFCVLCEETTTEGARLLAERVRHELEHTAFETELGTLRITASLGVATFPEHGKDRQSLFAAADKALYAAKHGGRNRVCTP